MSFSIAHGSPQEVWCPIVDSDTLYVGQLVQMVAEGAAPLGAASGAADTTNTNIVYGVVVATNNKTPVFNTTYQTEYITDATPKGSSTEFVGAGSGPFSMGGQVAMVKVALITPDTVIRGDVRENHPVNGIVGLNEGAVSGTANSANTSCTVDSGVGARAKTYVRTAPADGNGPYRTIYFRTGANRGQYRLEDNGHASSLHLFWDKPLYQLPAAGDIIVGVNGLKPNGHYHMQVDTESMYIDATTDASSNYYEVIVHRLDLREAGKEFCEFRFAPVHFSIARA